GAGSAPGRHGRAHGLPAPVARRVGVSGPGRKCRSRGSGIAPPNVQHIHTEEHMLKLLSALAKDESGQALAEYGLLLGVMAAAVVTLVVLFRTQVQTLWTNVTASLAAVTG